MHDPSPAPPPGANRLIFEKSPYLLQHAHNPVDWYPWGAEALARARAEDRPIFLSIGYSTCHWCHVMEHESFEDDEVARLLNASFVCIKVDREERPDLDGIYMTACQALTGSGGWPLTLLLTPEGKPFFAATYLPKGSRFGLAGLLDLLPRVAQLWRGRREDLEQTAAGIAAALAAPSAEGPGGRLAAGTLRSAYRALAGRFDAAHGGFGSAPKFPTPHQLTFLLRYWRRAQEPQALLMVEKSLRAMGAGGLWDHLGFGFHRYSTDAEWLVPHFEKMLYDQALLALAYVEAYQATGETAYRQTAEEIYTYVLRDLTAPEGGFYSAEDADSEGVEGKFYLWTADQVHEALPGPEGELVMRAFGVREQGNFTAEAPGQPADGNILHLRRPLTEVAREVGLAPEELAARLEAAREKLLMHRDGRVRPSLDDKILADWNGLMIAALARGAQAFGRPEYARAAQGAADFVLQSMVTTGGRLLHRYREGQAAVSAYLDDHAFLIWGLLELYEAGFEVRNLRAAVQLTDELLAHHWDAQDGGFFFTPDDGEALLLRQKEAQDGAVPSGNSVALANLLRLGRLTGRSDLEDRAAELEAAFSGQAAAVPVAFTHFLCGVDFALGPTYEVTVAGPPEAPDTRALLDAIRRPFLPNKVLLLRPTDTPEPDISALAGFTRDQTALGGRAAAYVCRDHACEAPTTEVQEALRLLGSP